MVAHCRRRAGLVAAQDRDHDAVVLGMRLGQAPEIAELGAAERLHPHPRGERHLGDIGVLRAGIDGVVEALIDLVKAVGIAGIAQHPQLLMHRLELVAFDRGHAFRRMPRAQGFQFGHRLEHVGEPLNRGPRHHRAAMRPRLDQAGGDELAQRLAHRPDASTPNRRAMSVSSSAAPGRSAPRTISSASCRRSSSARVIFTTDGDARSIRRTTASARGGLLAGRSSRLMRFRPSARR